MWLHGFTQTRDSAREFRTILAGRHELWTLDLPGHGEASGLRASLGETADLIARAIGSEPVVLGGYSLGGRVALHVALTRPDLVRRLILLGASRGIEDPLERAQRRERDEALAQRLETEGARSFLDYWLAQPLFAGLGDRAEVDARSLDARGLAASLRLCGTGRQEWLGPRLSELSMPVLALAGARDDKFSREARAIAEAVPHGSWALIPEAGHAAQLERPAACAEAVESFLVS